MDVLTLSYRYLTSGIIAILFLLSACKKDEKQTLPPKTHEGRNTIGYVLESGAVVGGNLWGRGEIELLDDGELFMSYHYYNAPDQVDPYHELEITFKADSVSGLYQFNTVKVVENGYTAFVLDSTAANAMAIEYQHGGEKIVSGVFDLTLVHIDTIPAADTTEIDLYQVIPFVLKQGRFDIRY